MRIISVGLSSALGLAMFITPLDAQTQGIRVCVVESGALRELAAEYNTVSGDTVIGGQRFSQLHPVSASVYAANAAWYQDRDQVSYDGENYEAYGLPRILGVSEVLPVGEFRGVTVFAESGSAHDTPEVVYLPVRPGCEFQPYQLALEPEPGVASGTAGRIFANDIVAGTLSPADARASDDSFYDEYLFTASAGEQVVIDLTSSDFDSYLVLGRGQGDGFDQIESNDDGPSMGTDARIEYAFVEAGEYTIRANSLNEGETGSYVLSVEGSGPAVGAAPSETPILSGQSLRGFLTADDAALDDGSHYDHYIYRASAGERVTVTLESDDFDAFLVVGRSPKGVFEEIDSNDDGAVGTDSELEITFPAAGDYILRANSLGAGETGEYTLSLERMR